MRRWLVPVLAFLAGAVAMVPLSVLATTGQEEGALDRQAATWRSDPVTTSANAWNDIPGLSGIEICAVDQVTVDVSVAITGAPLSLRALLDNTTVLQPIVAYFDPKSGTTSFSFTFVGNASSIGGDDTHMIDAQWKSSTSGLITLNRGDVNILFEEGPAPGSDCS